MPKSKEKSPAGHEAINNISKKNSALNLKEKQLSKIAFAFLLITESEV